VVISPVPNSPSVCIRLSFLSEFAQMKGLHGTLEGLTVRGIFFAIAAVFLPRDPTVALNLYPVQCLCIITNR